MARSARLVVAPLEDRVTPTAIGAPDPAFGTGGRITNDFGATDSFAALAIQDDGKIVGVGTTGSDFLLARFNTDGSRDTSFNTKGFLAIDFGGTDAATCVALQADGRILVGGYTEADGQRDFAIARLTATGQLDATFALTGKLAFDLGSQAADHAHALALNSFGGIYLAGVTNGGDMAVARLDPFGNLDKSFGKSGTAVVNLAGVEEARGVAVLANGSVVLSGFTNSGGTESNFVAVRLSADGLTPDFGFGNATLNNMKAAVVDLGGDDKAFASVLQPDGKLLLVGTDAGTGSDFLAVRLDAAGLPDASFNSIGVRRVGFGGTDEARSVALQPDGRIVVAGYTVPDRTAPANFAVTRLTAAGADDPTFGGARTLDFNGDDKAFAVVIDASDRIVLAGQSNANVAVGRLIGAIDLPKTLLTSGTADGSGLTFNVVNGQYVAGPGFNVFPGFTGTIRVASGDVTGDGVPDRIAGAGPGNSSVVVVYDGNTGGLVSSFLAFESSFVGGVLVSAGDFTGDGRAEVVVTADVGGGPRVRILDAVGLATNAVVPVADFFGIEDTKFRGGARPAVGDIDADGLLDLVIAAGPGGGPRIAIFDGRTVTSGTPTRIVGDFFAYAPTLRNGAFPATGDVDGDGFADLVLGAGPGGSPHVRVVGGRQLRGVAGFRSVDDVVGLQIATFFAGVPESRGGVTVTTRDVDGDGLADVVTGSGQGQLSEVRVYRGTTLLAAPAGPTPDQILDPYAAVLPGGVFVG